MLWISHRNMHAGFLTAGWRSLHGTHDPGASVIIHSQQKDTSVTSPRARRKRSAGWKLLHSSCGESRRNPFRTRAQLLHYTDKRRGRKTTLYFYWQQLLHTLRGINLSCFCNGWYHTKQRPILIWRCKSIRPQRCFEAEKRSWSKKPQIYCEVFQAADFLQSLHGLYLVSKSFHTVSITVSL